MDEIRMHQLEYDGEHSKMVCANCLRVPSVYYTVEISGGNYPVCDECTHMMKSEEMSTGRSVTLDNMIRRITIRPS